MNNVLSWLYNGWGNYETGKGAGDLIDSRNELIEACKEGYSNPTAGNAQKIRDAADEYRRNAAKSGTGLLVSDPILGKALGQLIDNENLRDYYHGNERDNKRWSEIAQALGHEDWEKDGIREQCTLEGITQLVNEIGNIPPGSSRVIDPLMIDLDGDGLELTSSIYFDNDNDGILNRTSWVGSDDGVLVFDINSNGLIENGSEIFGDDFVKSNGEKAIDGFDALRDLDSNNDGQFDSNDSNFADVNIWRDLDQDGVADDGELFTLESLGIQSIGLEEVRTNTPLNDSVEVSRSTVNLINGSTLNIHDVNLASSTLHTAYDHTGIELDDSIRSMANIIGMGRVDSLQYSMKQNIELKNLVVQFSSLDSMDGQLGLIQAITEQWAKTHNSAALDRIVEWNVGRFVSSVSTDPETGRRVETTSVAFMPEVLSEELSYKINILSAFYGDDRFKNVNVMGDRLGGALQAIDAAIDSLQNNFYELLVSQTRLNKYLDLIDVDFGSENIFNYEALNEYVKRQVQTGEDKLTVLEDILFIIERDPVLLADSELYLQLNDLIDLLPIEETKELLDEHNVSVDDFGYIFKSYLGVEIVSVKDGYTDALVINRDAPVILLAGDSVTNVTINAPEVIVTAGSGDDHVTTGSGEDLIEAGNGNDTINSGSGNDTIYGGAGNDTINTGAGDDIAYGAAGEDVINSGAGNDTIYGGAGNDTINTGAGDDKAYGGAGDDMLTNTGAGDTALYGEEGHDTLTGYYRANNTLDGGEGNDTLTMNSISSSYRDSSNSLRGGRGDDSFTMGYGSDTYHYDLGDGHDVIRDKGYDSSQDETKHRRDTLVLGAGITREMVSFTHDSAGNIIITITDPDNAANNGSIMVMGAYTSSTYRIEGIEFSGDESGASNLDEAAILAALEEMHGTEGSDVIQGTSTADIIYGENGGDTLYGRKGADKLFGGSGDDKLVGGGGKDLLIGGSGDDQLIGGGGGDTLNGGEGSDNLKGSAGNDTYLFSSDFGNDVINNYDSNSSSIDTAIFNDVSIEELWFSRDGNDLQINVIGTDNQVEISDWYSGVNYQLDKVQVGDSVLLNTQLEQLVSAMASFDVPVGTGSIVTEEAQDALRPILVESWNTL